MNILVITPWFPNNLNDQHGNFVLDSIKSLCEVGHSVYVLVTRPFIPYFGSKIKLNGCSLIEEEMFRQGFSLTYREYLSIPRSYLRFISNSLYLKGCAETVRRIIINNDIDVVHAHTELAGYLACAVAKDSYVPVVTTIHGINQDRRYLNGLGQRTFLNQAFSQPNRLVLVGDPLFSFVRKYVDSLDHLRVVHNGFRELGASPFQMRNVFSSTENIQIVSVSNLVKGKGIDVNLTALGQPKISCLPNWHYHIVGDGPLRFELEAQAYKLNIRHKVTFHGQCGHDAVYKILSTCDLFCLPSVPEAFGVAYLEAMAHGLLSIGIQGQGPSSYIRDGYSGILIPEDDIDSLTSRLLGILNNPKSYIAMSKIGQEHVWKHCTWQVHAKAMTHIFYEVMESHPNGRQTIKKI